MKSLRFALLVPLLTMAMLVPGHAQQEVMPDIFDPIPAQRVAPRPKPNLGTKSTAAKRMSAKAATAKPMVAAHPSGAPGGNGTSTMKSRRGPLGLRYFPGDERMPGPPVKRLDAIDANH
jgi:hypothetical protein